MAARRTKGKRRTRSSRTARNLNLASLAESALLANAITQGFFNASLNEFVMGKSSTGMSGASSITARELISGITGGSYGTTYSVPSNMLGGKASMGGLGFGAQVQQNLKDNGIGMVVSLALIPAGFKVFNKLSRKPRTMMNKALGMSGLPVKV
jgi:hypothetical protein|tara:strand:+ start:1705 stop:2163 length:459 start_codon:yes stop_codon:yes gene_type:complete